MNTNKVAQFELAAADAAGPGECLHCRRYRSQPPVSKQAIPLVCQALRLIVDGMLDEGTEDDLGARLGVSGRHLRRLFIDHSGVTPDQLARSSRLHFARQLLVDSGMSIAEITFAAGFGSIRQFNRECRSTFGATPTQLRAHIRNGHQLIADGGLTLRIPFKPPFDWQGWLSFTQQRAIGGVEHVSPDCYRRTVAVEGDLGMLEITPNSDDHLLLRAHLQRWKGLIHLIQRVRAMLNLDVDIDAANRHLQGDPVVGSLVVRRPGLRPPGAWDAFEAGIEAIIGAEASVAETAVAMQKLAGRYGPPVTGFAALGLHRTFPAPRHIATADLDELGLGHRATVAIRGLAQAAAKTPTAIDPSQDAYRPLVAALSSPIGASLGVRLGEPDAFLNTSPPFLEALSRQTGRLVTPSAATSIAEAWRPWRAHATAHLYWS